MNIIIWIRFFMWGKFIFRDWARAACWRLKFYVMYTKLFVLQVEFKSIQLLLFRMMTRWVETSSLIQSNTLVCKNQPDNLPKWYIETFSALILYSAFSDSPSNTHIYTVLSSNTWWMHWGHVGGELLAEEEPGIEALTLSESFGEIW